MFIVSVLLFIVAFLAVMGAGTLPSVVPLTAVLACSACWIAQVWPSGQDRRLWILASSLVLFVCVTALPLPRIMDSLVGHKRATQNELARQAIADAGKLSLAKVQAGGISISRDRAGTWRTVLLTIAAMAAAALASRLRPSQSEAFLQALVIVVTIVAAAGFISQRVIPEGKMLWWLFPVPHGQPVGGFLNRNQFGGFIALLCPSALILFSHRLGEKRWGAASIWALSFLIMTIAVVLSFSRGAWLAYGASVFAVAILTLTSRRPLMILAIVGLLAFVCWGISRLPHEDLEERAKTLAVPTSSETAKMRLSTWRDTIAIIPDYAFLGTGANAFRMVFPQYRTATTRKSFKHAENEYLQTPAEMGLIGIALLIGLGTAMAWRWWRNHKQGNLSRLIEISVGGALIVAAVHAVFDFAIRVPLYFIVLAALVGLTLAPPPPASSPETNTPRFLRWMPIAALILATAVALQGMRLYNFDSSDFMQKAGPNDLCRVLAWNPTSWQAWYHLGRTAIDKPDGTGVKLGEYCMTRATEYDPNNYRLWRELCLVRISLNDNEGSDEAYRNLKHLRTWQQIDEMERR